MTRAEAWKKIKRLIGERAAIRVGEEISGEAQRQKVRERLREIEEQRTHLDADINRRLTELTWYVERCRQKTDLWMERRKIEGYAHYYRFEAIRKLGYCNEILATGDTWEEVIQKLKEKVSREPR